MSKDLTYAGVGVDYDAMDPFKRIAQRAGRETAANITRLNGGEFQEFEASRGESCYLIEAARSYFAHVEEGLGTKNLVADAMYGLTGKTFYDAVAQDTVAMIVNDMVTLGALPLSVAMHLAVGESSWFQDEQRCRDLVEGWQHACNLSRCVWGGGETPTLKGVVVPGTVVLSGSAIGLIKPKERLIKGDVQDGDQIVLIDSSGIHANGLTLAREIATKVPQGYLAPLTGETTYGAALLQPTIIYAPLVEDCLNAGVNIHYAVNVTGHGWRKLMRLAKPFTYVIDEIPKPQPVFDFMQQHGPITDEEAYGNLNMGAGFALYVPAPDVPTVLNCARALGMVGRRAGHIEVSETKRVVITPKKLEYLGSTLQVR